MSLRAGQRRRRTRRIVRMSGTFTTDTAGPTAVTLLDRDHFARLLLIFKAQLLKQGSGSVEPGQLAFRAHNSRANSHDLFFFFNFQILEKGKKKNSVSAMALRLDESFPCRFRCGSTISCGR